METLEILQAHRVKKTPARMALLKALQLSESPLSENEIKLQMGDVYDRVTFYRNAQTLAEAGVIHRIVVDNTQIRYALTDTKNHAGNHVHFFCEACNKLSCLDWLPVGDYKLPTGYQMHECNVIIRGRCPQCV